MKLSLACFVARYDYVVFMRFLERNIDMRRTTLVQFHGYIYSAYLMMTRTKESFCVKLNVHFHSFLDNARNRIEYFDRFTGSVTIYKSSERPSKPEIIRLTKEKFFADNIMKFFYAIPSYRRRKIYQLENLRRGDSDEKT